MGYQVGEVVELLENEYNKINERFETMSSLFTPGKIGVVTRLIEDNPSHIYIDVGHHTYDFIFDLKEITKRRELK